MALKRYALVRNGVVHTTFIADSGAVFPDLQPYLVDITGLAVECNYETSDNLIFTLPNRLPKKEDDYKIQDLAQLLVTKMIFTPEEKASVLTGLVPQPVVVEPPVIIP